MIQTSPVKIVISAPQESFGAAKLPVYSEYPVDIDQTDIELAKLSRTSSSTTFNSIDEIQTWPHIGNLTIKSFKYTTQLQIQTHGRPLLMLPFLPTKPDPIVVWSLTADDHLERPVYFSLRPKRCEGSCYLVSGDDETETPLTTTKYRFGPGKPPKVNLVHAADPDSQEEFEIESKKTLSRTVVFNTALGTFQWRYAGSKERASESASSLLVLERLEDYKGFQKTTRIAQFVRNEQYRTTGTRSTTAGNGGRLMLDLSQVDEKHRENLQQLIVTTAILMLKKEVDRRRRHQFIVMTSIIAI